MEHPDHAKQDIFKVKLSKSEALFLKDLISVDIVQQGADFYVLGSRGLYVDLLDKLSDKLSEIGLDDKDIPNEKGLRVENLIDKFSAIVYD
ncbi:hypothetical protein AT05_11780 [Schleiferia thermophila str. Yellowstone]|jgi:hypothetical protein|uniref:Uncharacterized protein n=1 Tax=Schleiferia thermophila TaxID=884107 RepID=A0A368ZYT8_9FLAO|nr:hypothetical protein [Schleiferia thermophila]KFD38121.1 hypothetical protein AT05_11780 [Schleiferia thermophila str. Yellowstone]PMB17120.1 hypothetical protein CEN47_26460 [Fischerella thermalis CCMEE 5319]RCX00997.1 hypothetical protein DES35_1118 [Schleiferia thermophila]GCD80931.1 hypothetical protein JCM30197_21780 [Schleiferia thermophila]